MAPPIDGSKPRRGRPPGTTKTAEENQEARERREREKKEDSQLHRGLSSFLVPPPNNAPLVEVDRPDVFIPERIELDPSPIMLVNAEEEDDDDSFVTAAEELSDDDGDEFPDDEDERAEDIFDDLDKPDGIMQNYLEQVIKRIKEETRQDSSK